MKYDLHTHTKYSPRCGVTEPKKLVNTAIKKGLDGIAVTDHDTIKGALEAKKFETPDFGVIIGCEVSTDKGELIGLFLQDEITSTSPEDVIEDIHNQGGIVVVPHPFDEYRSKRFSSLSEYYKQIDAIEVFNSRCIKEKSNEAARRFANKNNLLMVGGSDAHYLNEVGLGYTDFFWVDDLTRDNMMYALEKSKINIRGKKSSLMNHARTKIRKWSKDFVTYR
ncbi:PHP domain protein [Methanohalobium evestigatum Z-7303]|uniref:PHP domain protein n=1 Tax=Methanohalobium evestigatum (strain ATCC BAA-1072 / DSM 3721 / NBRC 107634 / OCM 161 / Z-7303) TaxID=644295 RepID=D7E7P2_METEZ|nr:PHP domain-containing protein [Methanohalobium evestigatum]ADI74115.1 PHP domain protein [Methanohalobium evestigatum Z-7303]